MSQESCIHSWTLPLYVNGKAFITVSLVWMHLGTINYRWLKCRLASKVMYHKYSKHCPYLLPSTMDCGCNKIWNRGWNHSTMVSTPHCKPIPCNENRVFPVYFFSQGNPCNENRVPAMRTGFPCNENRFFPVRKSTQGKPCSCPVLALYGSAVHLELLE